MNEEIVTSDGHKLHYVYSPASSDSVGDVLLAHGITSDLDEHEGLFIKAAEYFVNRNLNVLRFDFRGHGASSIAQEKADISGEILDISTASKKLKELTGKNQIVVGCSFGAVSGSQLVADAQDDMVVAFALWNPVLDVRATFVDPGTTWSKNSINEKSLAELDAGVVSYLMLEDFRLGKCMVNDIRRTRLPVLLRSINVPILAFHGDLDDIVPIDLTRKAFGERTNAELRTLVGAGHGFVDYQSQVIEETTIWMKDILMRSKLL
ncbi:MAG: alpha/beta hydrolase [Pseudonocardia sp.]